MSDSGRLFTTAPVTRLRVEDSPNAEVVAELPTGTEVEVYQDGAKYVKVSAWHPEQGKVSGWVYKSFLGLTVKTAEEASGARFAQPPCPACGAQDWFLVECGSGTISDIHVPISFFESIPVKARVCRACGLYQRCLDQKGMDRLDEWLRNKKD